MRYSIQSIHHCLQAGGFLSLLLGSWARSLSGKGNSLAPTLVLITALGEIRCCDQLPCHLHGRERCTFLARVGEAVLIPPPTPASSLEDFGECTPANPKCPFLHAQPLLEIAWAS